VNQQHEVSQPVRAFEAVDVSSLEFWRLSAEKRDESFERLRRTAPVSWQPPVDSEIVEPDIDGYWAVVSHELVRQVSMDSETVCSGEGIQMEDLPIEILEAASGFLAMDGDKHKQMRRLMSSAFTPKQIKRLEGQIADRARTIAEGLVELGSGDFVENVSKQMPMNTFYDIAGLPQEFRDAAAHNADGMAAWNDPDVAQGRTPGEVLNESLVGNLTIGLEFAELTRACPRDDVWSNLVRAEVDGVGLTDDELATMFVLMSFAGNDTTRSTITLGTKALLDHPDQLAWLMEDYEARIDGAIEEVLRWTSPIIHMRRTATRDTELGGREIKKGDWVVMFYISANRDEAVFENPWHFDITRKPNQQFAFGGGGAHFCLGSLLAKMMLKYTFKEIFTQIPELTLGEPEPLIGNFARAFKTMPATTGCPVAP
jgi:cytochrome P450